VVSYADKIIFNEEGVMEKTVPSVCYVAAAASRRQAQRRRWPGRPRSWTGRRMSLSSELSSAHATKQRHGNVVPQQSVMCASWFADPAVKDLDHDDRRVDERRVDPMVAGVCGNISENIDFDRPVGL
jgi:hypothetical protein